MSVYVYVCVCWCVAIEIATKTTIIISYHGINYQARMANGVVVVVVVVVSLLAIESSELLSVVI